MAEPVETTVLRALDTILITCWWDSPSPDVREWLNIRSIKMDEGGAGAIRTIRLTRDEAMKMAQVITNG